MQCIQIQKQIFYTPPTCTPQVTPGCVVDTHPLSHVLVQIDAPNHPRCQDYEGSHKNTDVGEVVAATTHVDGEKCWCRGQHLGLLGEPLKDSENTL